jgi:hypothetical protein
VVLDVGPLPFALKDREGKATKYARLRGGMAKGTKWSAIDHEKANYRIDAFSMSRTDEQTKQVRFQLINQTMQQIAALPPQIAVSLNLPYYMKQAQAAASVRDLEQLFDPQVFYAMQSMLLGSQQPIEPQPQRTPQPRFEWNAANPMNISGMGRGHGAGAMSPRSSAPQMPKPQGPATGVPGRGAAGPMALGSKG